METAEWITALLGVTITSIFVWRWMRRKPNEENKNTSQDKDGRTNLPYKQPVAIHDIVSAKNGSEIPVGEGHANKAYKEDVFTQEPLKTTKDDLGKPRQSRAISDVSEQFRIPGDEDRSLSEIVIEEFDNKSKSLRSRGSGDLTDYRSSESGKEALTDASSEEESDLINAAKHRTTPAKSISRSLNRDEKGENITCAETSMESQQAPARQSTEWRDKLKQDLFNDDEEFMEESTDSELASNRSEDGKSGGETNGFDGADLDSGAAKGSKQSKNALSSPLSVSKLLGERALVIDNGSYLVRGGWAGEFAPAFSVRNVIGHWRADASEAWQEALGSKFVGQTAIERHSTLALNYPVEDGKVINWKQMQEVWNHVVHRDLESDFTQHPIIITESASVDPKQREKMVEVMIETLRVPGVCLRPQAVMCALSAGHKVGMVINSGHGTTEIVPTYSGYQLPYATRTLGIGGRHITENLVRLAQREHGISVASVADLEIVNTIKEKYGRVPNGEETMPGGELMEYQLPDGQVIQLGSEILQCTEPLYQPGLIGNASLGLTELIKHSLESLDPDVMAESDNTILLSGGNSKLKGFHSRLESEIREKLGKTEITVKFTDCDDSAAWIGASLLAEQSTFQDSCITEDVYFDYGASVVHRWCI